MSVPGPAPKPTETKKLAGNPGKRPLNEHEPKPKPVAPSMPRGMLPGAQKFWKNHAPALERLGLLTEADGAAFELMAIHYAIALDAATVIKAEGTTVEDERGLSRKHPALQILRDSSSAFRQYAVQFGLTPSARTRLSMPDPEEDDAFFSF